MKRFLALLVVGMAVLAACGGEPTAPRVAEGPFVAPFIGSTYEDTIAYRKAEEAQMRVLRRPGQGIAFDVYPGVPDCAANSTQASEFYTENPHYGDIKPGETWLQRIERGEIYGHNPLCRNWYLSISWSVNQNTWPQMWLDYQPDRQTTVVKHNVGNTSGLNYAQLYGAISGAQGVKRDTSYWAVTGF